MKAKPLIDQLMKEICKVMEWEYSESPEPGTWLGDIKARLAPIAQAHDAKLAAYEALEQAAREFVLSLDPTCLKGIEDRPEVHLMERCTQKLVYNVASKHFGFFRNALRALDALDQGVE